MRALAGLLTIGVALILSETPHAARLAPFFDSFNNPVPIDSPFGQKQDRTPTRKRITPFGSAVLRVCGRLGDPVSREMVHSLFEDPEWGWAVDPVHQRLFPDLDRDTFITRLSHIWSTNNAFRTIFCGDPHDDRMAGLHYHGRFADLHSQRVAGILPHTEGADEVVPGVIYGVPMTHLWEGRWVRTGIRRYAYKLDAHDILLHATAGALFMLPARGTTACVHKVEQDDGNRLKAVVVVKGNGLLTFYPDRLPLDELKRCDSL